MDLPDPNGHLEWLANELQKAEDAGEHVMILGHIPPGNHNMVPVWSHNFNRIVNRSHFIIMLILSLLYSILCTIIYVRMYPIKKFFFLFFFA